MAKDENDNRTADIETGAAPANDGSGATAVSTQAQKPARKPRGLSKKVQQLVKQAEEEAHARGFTEGLNHIDSNSRQSSGVLVWMLVAFIAGLIARNWILR